MRHDVVVSAWNIEKTYKCAFESYAGGYVCVSVMPRRAFVGNDAHRSCLV